MPSNPEPQSRRDALNREARPREAEAAGSSGALTAADAPAPALDPEARSRAAVAPTQGERLLCGGLALLALIASILPWWNSEIPLDRTAPTLNLWQLLLAGLSIPPLGAATGYSWLGNALFGLLGTLPALALLVALAVRAFRPGTIRASLIRLLGVATACGAIWMLVFAAMRADAANGRQLVSIGAWAMLAVGLAAAVLGHLWWQREKVRYPRRVKAKGGETASEEGRLEEIVGLDLDGDGDVAGAAGGRTSRAPEQTRFAFTADDALDDDEPDTTSIRIDTLKDDEDGR